MAFIYHLNLDHGFEIVMSLSCSSNRMKAQRGWKVMNRMGREQETKLDVERRQSMEVLKNM